jgi:autotransporter strand-loop-strand O-heptosyltransferase
VLNNKPVKSLDSNRNFVYYTEDQIKNLDYNNITSTLYWEMFSTKMYEHEHCRIKKGDVVVDIGANIGMFVIYANLMGAKKIYAYEPEPLNFACLQENKTDNCEIFYKAVGERTKIVDIYIAYDNFGGHSVVSGGRSDKVTVECIGINELIESVGYIDYLKIDCEGSEYQILSSISNENIKKISKICIEYHPFYYEDGNANKEKIKKKFGKYFEIHDLPNSGMSQLYFWKKRFDQIVAYTSFVPFTGYAYHAREFLTPLNSEIQTRVKNFAYVPDISHLTPEQYNMLIHQTWIDKPYTAGVPYNRNPKDKVLNIILLETNHFWYYNDYDGPKIAYNVWESTEQPYEFFEKLKEFDQIWVPTEWQRQCTIEQGMPEWKVKVVPEAVNGAIFNPDEPESIPEPLTDGRFKFMIFGRWDYRKYTTEMMKAFVEEFLPDEPVDLIVSIDNEFEHDGLSGTDARLEYHGIRDSRIKNIGYVDRDDYVSYMKKGNALLHCSRSEGWGLPAIEAIACGTPTIIADWGASLEFADGIAHTVKIAGFKKPGVVFMQKDGTTPGYYCEPDFQDLKKVMRDVYTNYKEYKEKAIIDSAKVREKFTWDNAVRKALQCMEEIDMSKHYPVRLNLGSGPLPLQGYTNIDLDYSSADINMNVLNLDQKFGDETVDEIYSSHLLEHISNKDIPIALSKWYGTLKKNGKLHILIPDLKWCMENWINSPEDEKWGYPIDTIFGQQGWVGNTHITGFTKERITKFLTEADFSDINIMDIWSHSQMCFDVQCHKKGSIDDDICIIDCYPDNEDKLNILREKIKILKTLGKHILVVTHYPLPDDISKNIDYLIFDKRNIMSEEWRLIYWFQKDDLKVIYSNPKQYKYHAVGCYTSLKNAVNLIIDKYKFAHFIEYDVDVDITIKHLVEARYQLQEGKSLFAIKYHNSISREGINTALFSFNIKWMYDALPEINTWAEYQKLYHNNDPIFEDWFYELIKRKKGTQGIHLIDRNIENLIEREGHVHFLISETDDNKIMLFIINVDKEKSFDYKVVYNGGEDVHEGNIGINDAHYSIFEKKGTIECYSGYIYQKYELDEKVIYEGTRFKFKDGKINCISWNPRDDDGFITNIATTSSPDISFNYSFHNCAKCEILGKVTKEKYNVEFKDMATGFVNHQMDLDVNNWTSTFKQYYTDWLITVRRKSDGVVVSEHRLDLANKNVIISFESTSIGDNIAWMPYVEEFRKKHNCKIFLSTFHNEIFKKEYPEIFFIEPGTVVSDTYAIYTIGCWDDNYNRNKNFWRLIPLQQICTDVLGLEYTEIRPKLTVTEKIKLKKKYIAISIHSTLQGKYWNYPMGWQQLINHYIKKGYDIMVISKEPNNFKNVIDRTNKPLQKTINNIAGAEMFIGISSGTTRIAWALGIPTVLISGITQYDHEMKDCARVINEEVCNSCWKDKDLTFDRGNWMWCPRSKNFICTTSITPEMVIKKIEEKYTFI